MNTLWSNRMLRYGAAALAALLAGCYIGRASFEGENMRMYPFFSFEQSSATSPEVP